MFGHVHRIIHLIGKRISYYCYCTVNATQSILIMRANGNRVNCTVGESKQKIEEGEEEEEL